MLDLAEGIGVFLADVGLKADRRDGDPRLGLAGCFFAIREVSSIKAGDETDGKEGVLRREAGGTNDEG